MMTGEIKKMAQSLELSEILRIFAADMTSKNTRGQALGSAASLVEE